MRPRRHHARRIPAAFSPSFLPSLAVAAMLAAPAAAAQPFPAFGGIEARVGAAGPEKADAGFSMSADVDLGSVATRRLRTFAGVTYFTADADLADAAGAPITGQLTALGGRVGLRLDIPTPWRLTPFVLGQLSGYDVDADDVNDPTTRELLRGFVVGAGAGAGLAYRWSEEGKSSVVLEARQVAVNNVAHWAVELGFRYGPRGRDDLDDRAAALERERRRIASERARTQEVRQEVRQEARQSAAEEQRRADSLAAATRAAESARLRAEEDRRATEAAAAAERARLQSAADAEAEARRQAEREAAAAQAAAASAEAAARAATERAAEMERQLRDSLLELDRLVANVSGVRETERGLLLVLGQGLFATAQSTLSTAARADVGRIATILARFPDRTILVEGHTDSVGSEASNQRLSEQRAEAVRAALIAEGLDPTRITATGYGESRPVADDSTAEGRSQNRRVEIVIARDGG